MKLLPILALIALAPVAGATVSSHAAISPSFASPGEPVTVTYTRNATLLDGLQDGAVTLSVRGTANATLASLPYHFEATLTASSNQTLTWTWTPKAAGAYTLTFTDHPTQGPPSNQTTEYHVEDASGGGGGWIEAPSLGPWRGVAAACLFVLGLGLVASTKPRRARHRALRALGAALVLVGVFLLCVWWWP